ncbi:hypothetical protein BCR34DRAFT_555363 [Clohesyomyces aquaticus]|uniref:Uncharacterized protein n=1 Tax=Clohesyomyces aquaticus TaxID=1231657 RepID=A0A1Y2A4H4_9PLEO|nr:hypothetical protein BCR34DRAFT_555363 [Clohesyomyces aquaticus]
MTNKLFIAALPIAGSAIYLTYLHITLSRKVSCQTTPYLQDSTITLPPNVTNKSSDTMEKIIIYHECARKSISTSSIKSSSSSIANPKLLTHYIRHTMSTFSSYLPAWAIWYCLSDLEDRQTFNRAYINSLPFEPGDRVCGVYVVESRDQRRVTLALNAPASYTGPIAHGVLVVEAKEEGSEMVFANHTVMWREKGKGSPGVLESRLGRWMHGLQVRGLVESGVARLMERHCE